MTLQQFPHCDAMVLHSPGVCRFCDKHPDWQELRKVWHIAFTGEFANRPSVSDEGTYHGRGYSIGWEGSPPENLLPCPADFVRPPDSKSDHRRWAGNVATTQEPVNETFASKVMYGEPEVARTVSWAEPLSWKEIGYKSTKRKRWFRRNKYED